MVTALMGADMNNIIKTQRLSDDHVQFLVYQVLRAMKVINQSELHDVTNQGPVVQSLVNDSLRFQMAMLQIHCYFLLIKCENPLQCKGFSDFFNKK